MIAAFADESTLNKREIEHQSVQRISINFYVHWKSTLSSWNITLSNSYFALPSSTWLSCIFTPADLTMSWLHFSHGNLLCRICLHMIQFHFTLFLLGTWEVLTAHGEFQIFPNTTSNLQDFNLFSIVRKESIQFLHFLWCQNILVNICYSSYLLFCDKGCFLAWKVKLGVNTRQQETLRCHYDMNNSHRTYKKLRITIRDLRCTWEERVGTQENANVHLAFHD